MTQEQKNTPNALSAAVKAMQPAIEKCRVLDGGWAALQASSTEYLPKHPEEKDSNYLIRLNRPVHFNAYTRSVDGLTGLVFRRDPVLAEDVGKDIEALWENIDYHGTHGAVFCKALFREALVAGRTYLMVDGPQVTREMSLGEEREMGLRPYWVHYRVDEERNREYAYVNGKLVLRRIVFEVTSYVPDGEFGDREESVWRVFRLDNDLETVRWEQWKKNDKEVYYKDAEGVLNNVTEIPIAVVYGRKLGPFMSKPPLEDLADQNLLFYQTSSDYHHAAHIANVPVPFLKGFDEDANKITWGPNATLIGPEGSDAKWLETSASALGHTRTMLEDIKGNMATLGLNMLAREKRAAETATARRIDKAEADSALGAIARSLEDAIELALGYTAQFLKSKSGGGSIEVNRDYEEQQLTPQEIQVYSQLVASGQLSLETMWKMLEAGEILPPDFDPELERVNLESDMGDFSDTQDKEGLQGNQPQDGQAPGDLQDQGGSGSGAQAA